MNEYCHLEEYRTCTILVNRLIRHSDQNRIRQEYSGFAEVWALSIVYTPNTQCTVHKQVWKYLKSNISH